MVTAPRLLPMVTAVGPLRTVTAPRLLPAVTAAGRPRRATGRTPDFTTPPARRPGPIFPQTAAVSDPGTALETIRTAEAARRAVVIARARPPRKPLGAGLWSRQPAGDAGRATPAGRRRGRVSPPGTRAGMRSSGRGRPRPADQAIRPAGNDRDGPAARVTPIRGVGRLRRSMASTAARPTARRLVQAGGRGGPPEPGAGAGPGTLAHGRDSRPMPTLRTPASTGRVRAARHRGPATTASPRAAPSEPRRRHAHPGRSGRADRDGPASVARRPVGRTIGHRTRPPP